jgi:glutathione S-transferase
MNLCIVGRSSSHFTRVVRVVAHDLGVDYAFRIVPDLTSRNSGDWGGNPALKLPVLETDQGAWYGALSICRELARRAGPRLQIRWPEQVTDRVAANAQELVLQGMATEVNMIMQGLTTGAAALPAGSKQRASLTNSLVWLDAHLPAALASSTSDNALSFLEVTTFCFVSHLGWRRVVELGPYPNLLDFCSTFGHRASARATEYRFDSTP